MALLRNYFITNLRFRRKFYNLAGVFYKTRLLSVGENLPYTTHPLQEQFKRAEWAHSVHAEVSCLIKLKQDYKRGLELVSLRFSASGGLLNAKPCSGCQAAIRYAGFPGAWYSTSEGKLEWLTLS